MSWDPAQTRNKYGLFITDSEKKSIYANFEPLSPGELRADGVFEGGGVLGIAFLGALRCCDDLGIKWCDLGGTSAGAITASLLAADYTLDELEQTMGELDYTSFLAEHKTFASEFNILSVVELTLRDTLGAYSTKPFLEWIEAQLKKKGIECFADVKKKKRALKVVASDITRAEMIVCPDSLDFDHYHDFFPQGSQNFSVAKAVMMSMSIPFFFEPYKFGTSFVVDGGVTSNFPLWIFDSPPDEIPPYPTFGFRLIDTKASPSIDSPIDLMKAMVRTMRFAHDRFYLEKKELNRVINIDLSDIEVHATQFDLTDKDKADLYTQGYKDAKRFFLNQWNWKKHLEDRRSGQAVVQL